MALESAYIAQLNPMEQKILQIAKSHLETSFSLKKSIGFQEWQKTQQEQKQGQAEQKQAEQKPSIKAPKKKPVIKIKSIPS